MGDNLNNVMRGFYRERTQWLFDRYAGGPYRGVVRETNDPLRHYRIRVLIPELYDSDTKTECIKWVSPSPWMGGKGSGSWVSPSIGDIVWVSFEKGHAYGPIWIGFADPSRVAFYPNESLYGSTPTKFDLNKLDDTPGDDPIGAFLSDFFPADNRPMSMGSKDRYGNTFVINSVGFYPKEHEAKPAPVGVDGITNQQFNLEAKKPKVNDPDVKHVSFITKYGHMAIMSDVGYKWDNEFSGDFSADKDFENDRSTFYAYLKNESLDIPNVKDVDQRRIMFLTRAGHKFELRDVGWNKSRQDFGASTVLSDQQNDERWIKLRTKGGHLIQLIDIGYAEDDEFYNRSLLEESGSATEFESESESDQRMIRFISRYGFKFCIDDRGSSLTAAHSDEEPRGNGIMLKGRRDSRGFVIEFNEQDVANRLLLSSPTGKGVEINDRYGYVGLHTNTTTPISEKLDDFNKDKFLDNHFATEVAIDKNFEYNTHHLKLDLFNHYNRFKTPEGAGLESRDSGAPCGSWTELVDNEDRGLWMSATHNRSILRDKFGKKYIAIDDNEQFMLIRNNLGIIQLIALSDIDIISGARVNIHASDSINLIAGQSVNIQGGRSQLTVGNNVVGANVPMTATEHRGYLPGAMAGSGAQSPSPRSFSHVAPLVTDISPIKPFSVRVTENIQQITPIGNVSTAAINTFVRAIDTTVIEQTSEVSCVGITEEQ